MRPFPGNSMRGRFADAAACADDHDHVTREFFFRRHALELGFLQQPVLDIERFLARQSLILADGFRAAHDFDGERIELGSDPALAFIFTPGNQPQSGNQDDRRIRVTHGR